VVPLHVEGDTLSVLVDYAAPPAEAEPPGAGDAIDTQR
jgi:hypothetical protein